MKPLGHRTHLKGKPGGESSMFGKAGCSETAELHAGRGPDGKVKPGLVEVQSPQSVKVPARIRQETSVVPGVDGYKFGPPTHALRDAGRICGLKGTKWSLNRPERQTHTERGIA